MAFKGSDYPEIRDASKKYDIAKSEYQKLDSQLNETSRTSKNYKDLLQRRNAAKKKLDSSLDSYKMLVAKRKSEYEQEQKSDRYNKDLNSNRAKLKSLNESLQRAKDKGEDTTSIQSSIDKVTKSIEGIQSKIKSTEKNKRPEGVPADAKFDEKTKQWTRGSDKWDSAGKKVIVTKKDTETDKNDTTETGVKNIYKGQGTFDNPLIKDGKNFSGEYQGKKYENGILLPEKPEPGNVSYQGVGTEEAPFLADGKPFTGTYNGKSYTNGILSAETPPPDGPTGPPSPDGLKPDLEKVFAEAVKRYGDIDEIFKTNPELRGLLESAIGKVDDINDDYTEGQFLNLLKNTNWWQSQAGVVRQRGFLKRQYDKLVAKLDKNSPTYDVDLEKLNAENEYGRGISETYNTLQSLAQGMGADLTTEQLNSLASKVYSLGYNSDQTYMTKLLTPYVSTAGMASGTAGQTLQALRQTARNNGFDLDTKFGAQMNEWVRQVAGGRSIDDFKNIIREEAAKDQGKYVTDLLRSGYDLDGIYGNYISLMAQRFNIDPTTIKPNDPILSKVFDDKGGMKFSDFETLLRSDPRYKGTPGMAAEKDFRQSILDRAVALGISLAEKDVDDIANNVLSMGIGASSSLVDGLIRAKFRYAPGTAIGGFAGNNLATLRQTAAANGLDLDKAFTNSEIQSWLSNVLQGESVETYKRRIRQVAGAGLPDKIASLLDLGNDLESIYSPYKNVMANTLEINPETITVNDRVLRQAIGPEKEMSIYEWERFLRKDPRWQYTNNARQETSESALSVLRDFGFQG